MKRKWKIVYEEPVSSEKSLEDFLFELFLRYAKEEHGLELEPEED